MDYVIGIDFDNTIVNYDTVFYDEALRRGFIVSGSRKGKKDIRDMVRRTRNGEVEWQKVQATVYGPRMNEAKLIDGVKAFCRCCKASKVRLCIVSHKTEYAKMDNTRTNLREAALSWMKAKRFFESNGLGLSTEDVFFESMRYEKIQRIKKMQCTHFIDDLEETFLEEAFPADIEKILYMPHLQYSAISEIKSAASWEEVKNYVFGSSS